MLLQCFIGVSSLTGLLMAAAIEERRRAEQHWIVGNDGDVVQRVQVLDLPRDLDGAAEDGSGEVSSFAKHDGHPEGA